MDQPWVVGMRWCGLTSFVPGEKRMKTGWVGPNSGCTVVPLCPCKSSLCPFALQPACDSAQVSHRDSVVTRWFMLLCPFRRQYEYDHIPAFNAVLQGRCLCACKKGNFEARDCFCRWFWLPGATPCGHVQCGESFEGDGVKSVSEAGASAACKVFGSLSPTC